MNPDEKKTVDLSANESFGPRYEDNIWIIKRSSLPKNVEPQVGMTLEKIEPNSQKINILITEVSESTVTLDANHPIAGKDLLFFNRAHRHNIIRFCEKLLAITNKISL